MITNYKDLKVTILWFVPQGEGVAVAVDALKISSHMCAGVSPDRKTLWGASLDLKHDLPAIKKIRRLHKKYQVIFGDRMTEDGNAPEFTEEQLASDFYIGKGVKR